jgi:hypothetical protein
MIDMNFSESETAVDILPGKFNGHQVRFCYIKTEPWFVAKDVCQALGYKNHFVTLRKLGNDEATVTRNSNIKIRTGNHCVRLINVDGIDKLSAMSYGPGASKFPLFISLTLWESMVSGVHERIKRAGSNGVSLQQIMQAKPYPGAVESEVLTALDRLVYDASLNKTPSGIYQLYQEQEPTRFECKGTPPNLDLIQFSVILYFWETRAASESLYAQMKSTLETLEAEGVLEAAGISAIYEPQKYNTAKRFDELQKKLFGTDKRVLWLVDPDTSKRLMTKAKNFSRELIFQQELLTRSRGIGRRLAIIAFDEAIRYEKRPDFIKQDTRPTSITQFMSTQSWL